MHSDDWLGYGRWMVAAAGTAATALLGGWDAVLQALVVLVALDYVTGVASAWAGKRLSSETGARGIVRKIGIFIVVALATVVDRQVLPGEAPLLRTLAIWFYLANEGLSIIENLGEIGVPIPTPVREALQRLKGRAESAGPAGGGGQ